MSVSLIGNPPSLNINNRKFIDRDGDNDSSRVSNTNRSGRSTYGGGAFAQSLIQSLQDIGLNVPGQSVNPVARTDASTSSQDGSSTTTNDPLQSLHQLMHDLRQAVNQMGSQPTASKSSSTSTTDSDGDQDNSSAVSSAQNNGYNDFATNLQNLISFLKNTSGSTDGTGKSSVDKLQSDFSNLVKSLNNGNSASSVSGDNSVNSNPNLQDFLTNLLKNMGNNSSFEAGPGSLIQTNA